MRDVPAPDARDVAQQDFAGCVNTRRRFRDAQLDGREFGHAVIAARHRAARNPATDMIDIAASAPLAAPTPAAARQEGCRQKRHVEQALMRIMRPPGVCPLVASGKVRTRCSGTKTSSRTSVLEPVPASPPHARCLQ